VFALVQALSLPAQGTILGIDKIDSDRVPISIGRDVIAADVTFGVPDYGTLRIWRNGAAVALPEQPPSARSEHAFLALGVVSPAGVPFVDLVQPVDGADIGIDYDAFRLAGAAWKRVDLKKCRPNEGYAGHILRIEPSGALDVSYEHSSHVFFDEVGTSEYAPEATRIVGSRCDHLGTFNLRAVAGAYAVGYRGYLHGGIVPIGIDTAQQTFKAVSSHDGRVRELGVGEAFDVAPDGFTVGSDAPPFDQSFGIGNVMYRCCTPHPVAWTAAGEELHLAPKGVRGVAYSTDASHRIAGSIIDRDGRHYAFLWDHNRLRLLDQLTPTPGWHFEAAYGFTQDGAVVGVGTKDGVATAFIDSLTTRVR
jgi:hypothetical protein